MVFVSSEFFFLLLCSTNLASLPPPFFQGEGGREVSGALQYHQCPPAGAPTWFFSPFFRPLSLHCFSVTQCDPPPAHAPPFFALFS